MKRLADEMREVVPGPGPALREKVLARVGRELAAGPPSVLVALHDSRLFWASAAAVLIVLCLIGWSDVGGASPVGSEMPAVSAELRDLAHFAGDGELVGRLALARALGPRGEPSRRPWACPGALEDME